MKKSDIKKINDIARHHHIQTVRSRPIDENMIKSLVKDFIYIERTEKGNN